MGRIQAVGFLKILLNHHPQYRNYCGIKRRNIPRTIGDGKIKKKVVPGNEEFKKAHTLRLQVQDKF